MQAPEKTRSKNPLRPFLKLFFYLLYHPFAWSYDLVAAAVSAGRWKRWVLHTATFLSGPHILELGHGPGHLQERLAADKQQVYGIDRSQQMGRIAHRRLSRLSTRSRLTRATAMAIPFPDAYFNTVVATFPTEYISETAALREINRVLAPDGKLVILLSAWITGGNLRDRALAYLFKITGQTQPVIPSSESSIKRLEELGFHAHLSLVEFETSRLLLLIADKR
jgi:ubiquinone/menaquinone biosynthesis C-methylase UbiE